MRTAFLVASALLVLCSASPANGDAPAGEGSLTVVLDAAPYRLTEVSGGQRIEMQGFDYLKEPGRPMLPEKDFLILLPPGARSPSLEVLDAGAEPLPGKYSIAPTPPLLPLAGAPLEVAAWEESYHAAYSDDRAYPEGVARITGWGGLRKYSYVRISFRPFAYRAVSGTLAYHDSARVRIRYALPEPAGAEARHARELLRDMVADTRAAALFANHDEMKAAYETVERAGAPASHHDYVIVTTPALQDAITASGFLAWKSSLGFDVRIVLTSSPEIDAQPGVDLPERVRNFLRANYGPWGIEYVLFVGNATVPMRYCFPDPSNHYHDPSNPGTAVGSVPTDAYYADLSLPDAESWDLDGDGYHGEYGHDNPDFVPEVYVGRIPTDSGSRVTYTLDKLVRFEQDNGAWKSNALHAGAVLFYENQDLMGIPFRDGAVCMDEIESDFMPGSFVSRYSEQEGLVPSTFAWPALTQEAFINDWRTGAYGIVNWAGHGSPDAVWRTMWMVDDGDGIPETDGSDVFDHEAFIADWVDLDDDYPSIVTAVSCNVGYPEPNGSGNLGIDLLTDPTLGAAAAVVSASRFAYVSADWPALPGGAESVAYEFNRFLLAGPEGPARLGEALHEAKCFCNLNYGWESHPEYRGMYDYNLYGDPAADWRGASPRRGNLLRNSDVWQLLPLAPPLGDILPLAHIGDLHVPQFAAGDVDPDSFNASPLVFYSVDASVSIWLGKTPSGEVSIDF